MKQKITRTIGIELLNLRKLKHLKISDVAEQTNIHKDTICKYENGKSSMKIYLLADLLEFYDVDFKYFFDKIYDRLQNIKEGD